MEASAEPTITKIETLKEDADFHAFHLKASLVASGLPLVYHEMEYAHTSSEGVVSFRAMVGRDGAHYFIHYDPATYEIGIAYNPPPHQVDPVEIAFMVLAPGVGKIVSRGISKVAAKYAGKRVTKFFNLVSKARTEHILYGDATGGGHMFGLRRLLNGKSKFSILWSRERSCMPFLMWRPIRRVGGYSRPELQERSQPRAGRQSGGRSKVYSKASRYG